MAIYEHLSEFASKPVVDWPPAEDAAQQDVIYRIGLSYDEADEGQRWTDKFADFLDHPVAQGTTGLVVGIWFSLSAGAEEPTEVVEALVTAREQLPNLRAIFFGDITMEESEISWIEQGDLAPIFAAYPALEHFSVRGTNGLTLGTLRHNHLRSLTIQSGGLATDNAAEVMGAQLPELEHLELWLGDENYGADVKVPQLEPLLSGHLFPKLRYLGLRNSEIADEIAAAVAQAPVLERLEVLDLSLGTLGDEGAEALLRSANVHKLQSLDIHHHYCSPTVVEQFNNLGIRVNTTEALQPDEYDGEMHRYVAVGE